MLSQYARLFARILIPDGMGFFAFGQSGSVCSGPGNSDSLKKNDWRKVECTDFCLWQ